MKIENHHIQLSGRASFTLFWFITCAVVAGNAIFLVATSAARLLFN